MADPKIEEYIQTELAGIAQGAAADIQQFGVEIAADLALVKGTGNENAEREIKAQARALAGAHRVSLSDAGWRGFEFGLGLAAKLLAALCALFLLFVPAGCKGMTAPGALMAKDVHPLVEVVVERHDAFVPLDDAASRAQSAALLAAVDPAIAVQVSRVSFAKLAAPVLDRHDELVLAANLPITELKRALRSTAILRKFYPGAQ